MLSCNRLPLDNEGNCPSQRLIDAYIITYTIAFLYSGDGTVAEVGIDGGKATKSTFISPTIPATASVGELLDYLGDTKTRRRVSLSLVKPSNISYV